MNHSLDARPIEVVLDGVPLTGASAAGVSRVSVHRDPSRPSRCDVAFADLVDPAEVKVSIGAGLHVAVGGEPLFEGAVLGIQSDFAADGEHTVIVHAEDALHALAGRQSVRAMLDLDVEALARELVGALGLRVVGHSNTPRRSRIVQLHQSDLALLRDAAERSGLVFSLRHGTVHVFGPQGLEERPRTLALGENLLEARFTLRGGETPGQVDLDGWDVGRARHVEASAHRPRAGVRVPAVEHGAAGAGRTSSLVNELVQDEADAQALAQGALDRLTASRLYVAGTANGDVGLEPGAAIEITGVGQQFSGTYVLASVEHTVDATYGFLTRFDTRWPASLRTPASLGAAMGLITRIDDPERLGRVRVVMPGLADVESDWLAVVVPGAGAGKGVIGLPDVGDRVLVLLLGGESGEALVLGGLYGDERPPELGRDGSRAFAFVTPGGQRIVLSDEQGGARIENRDGSHVTLAPDRVTVHAERDLIIEAPGRRIAIRGARIDFERS